MTTPGHRWARERSRTNAIRRVVDVLWGHTDHTEDLHELAADVLTGALDDPDLGAQISTWRRPCGHSRLVNVRGELAGSEETGFEDGCSPCVRDRMRAYFLGEP
jgi:hypothetical protein